MIIRFSVKNFRSIYERQDLIFQASKFSGLQASVIKNRLVGNGILPLIAIYGANAAGKSNILRAMHYMYTAVKSSHNKWEPQTKILVDPHFFHKDEPSEFECEFLLQKEIYRFGFRLTEERIESEYLYVGKTLIYSRKGNRYRLGKQLQNVDSIKRNTRPNALFISTAAQNNHPLLRKIHAWFSSWDTITDDRSEEEALAGYAASHDATRSFLAKALAVISPDIVGIELGEITPIGDMPGTDPGTRALLEDHRKWQALKITHESVDKKRFASLILSEESRGTQSYFTLANSIILVLAAGSILLLDEADQSLHPSLLRSIVRLFQNPSTNPFRAQLIFNTHETSLLVPDVLRPDQVWFVERDNALESRLFSLADFEGIRSETKTQRAYLEGRFGAIPFLDAQETLFADYLGRMRKGRHDA